MIRELKKWNKKKEKNRGIYIISRMSLDQAKSQWICVLIAIRHELFYIFGKSKSKTSKSHYSKMFTKYFEQVLLANFIITFCQVSLQRGKRKK